MCEKNSPKCEHAKLICSPAILPPAVRTQQIQNPEPICPSRPIITSLSSALWYICALLCGICALRLKYTREVTPTRCEASYPSGSSIRRTLGCPGRCVRALCRPPVRAQHGHGAQQAQQVAVRSRLLRLARAPQLVTPLQCCLVFFKPQ